MISIEYLRNNYEEAKKSLLSKGAIDGLDEIISIDKDYRKILMTVNDLRADRNKTSDEIAELKKSGEDANDKIISMRRVSEKIKDIENELSTKKEKIDELLLNLPNIAHESVPEGLNQDDNKIVSRWGEDPKKDFTLKTHVEIGKSLNLFDFERSAKISGSGFPLLIGKGALLERALINFMLDTQTVENNYIEIFPPFLVNSDAVLTTGNLPKFSEDMYHSEIDNLWLIPTAEVPITNIHKNEILSEDDLPKKYTAYSACFRREAGSYGKETKGFLRLHQFNKVELVQFTHPKDSYKILEDLTFHIVAHPEKDIDNVSTQLGQAIFIDDSSIMEWDPHPNYNGLLTIGYYVSDGIDSSQTNNFQINILPVNDNVADFNLISAIHNYDENNLHFGNICPNMMNT